MQGAIKRFYDKANATLTSGGSSNAYTLTYSVAPGSLITGERYAWKANHSNTGPATLNINSLGATAIKQRDGSDLEANTIISGAVVETVYDGTNFQLTAGGGTTVGQSLLNAPTVADVREIVGVDVISGRNRIINGAMRIDQRKEGASNTINGTSETYTLDRWYAKGESADGVFTVVRSTSTPVSGFPNFLRVTATTADASIGSSQSYLLGQKVEGYNTADLGWGAAGADDITVSFWVRSSLSGDFSGAIRNSAKDRSYPFTYNIGATNTWEYRSFTVAGDTSGTWLTTNGIGAEVVFDLGAGASNRGTAGAWANSAHVGVTSAVSVIGTLNATWDITGVQVERGTVATEFEFRPITTELELCQRYYAKTFNQGTAPAQGAGSGGAMTCKVPASSACVQAIWQFPVRMRATPSTVTTYSTGDATANWWNVSAGGSTGNAQASVGDASVHFASATGLTVGEIWSIHASAVAEL